MPSQADSQAAQESGVAHSESGGLLSYENKTSIVSERGNDTILEEGHEQMQDVTSAAAQAD
jgi:hypothetical protein